MEEYNPNSSSEIDHESLEMSFPPLPMKPLIISVTLLLVGIGLMIAGFIEEAVDVDPTRGIASLVLGSLLLIPGSYFSFKFYKAYRASTPRERLEILKCIPNM